MHQRSIALQTSTTHTQLPRLKDFSQHTQLILYRYTQINEYNTSHRITDQFFNPIMLNESSHRYQSEQSRKFRLGEHGEGKVLKTVFSHQHTILRTCRAVHTSIYNQMDPSSNCVSRCVHTRMSEESQWTSCPTPTPPLDRPMFDD